ncbi:hypothetical protein Acor_38910 [Acrocarpospora corrugata]|uniref:Uncharacterized protein n=1 Tax=Acrocarpospora corrugata TaxID=35763 RepID=A0A5M3VZA2_9ACTN|nr:PadR family transcriptional regulator [Acrocarpospora corrugata]GES01826.1 hypothetical protein Acor_38910 [Acrocarpospora corrugata]
MESPALSLTEWVALAIVAEAPTHGFAIARLTSPTGPVGTVWQVPRPLVYRALDRLLELGLAESLGNAPGSSGPQRRLLGVTESGRVAVTGWLVRPVGHIRDIRTEFLIKLTLLGRAGLDTRPLLDSQAERLRPIVTGLRDQCDAAHGLDLAVASWRYETAAAALRLTESAGDDAPAWGAGPGAGGVRRGQGGAHG